MSSRFFISLFLVGASLSSGCRGDTPPSPKDKTEAPWFEVVTESAGIDFTYSSGHTTRYLMPEIVGGGVALADLDGDGWLDLYLVQGGRVNEQDNAPGNRLLRNRGNGTFQDITEGSGAGDTGYGMGVTCGDVDNDGDTDLYVTNLGPDVLLINDGAGQFHDGTKASGLGHSGWSTSATFLDHDRDGDLDLFVAGYLDWTEEGELTCHNDTGNLDYCSPQNYLAPTIDRFYRNDAGVFVDITKSSGIYRQPGTGLGVAPIDVNGDGWMDIFVANDGMPDALWKNQGDGTFRDEALLSGCALDHSGASKAGMGVAVADVDEDGDDDLLVCNLDRQSDSFFLNEGGAFRDATAAAGLSAVSRPFTRFGLGFSDFNLDGILDLFFANGRVTRRDQPTASDPFAEHNLLLQGHFSDRVGEKTLAFDPVKTADGTTSPTPFTSRAAAFGDIDNDGDVDILVVNRDGPARLYRNLASSSSGASRWIGFHLLNEQGSEALGAKVTATLAWNDPDLEERLIQRTARASSSYLASNDPRIHIGLESPGLAKNVQVTWSDGATEFFGDLPSGTYHRLIRNEGL